MIVVTGGAGFIGSNLIRGLNELGIQDIVIVDDINCYEKWVNIRDLKYLTLINKDMFLNKVICGEFDGRIEVIFHQGACSNTMEDNEEYLHKNNFLYSKVLFDFSMKEESRFIYASSASVYGMGDDGFTEMSPLRPLNLYAYFKGEFDRYVESKLPDCPNQVVGLRYFNVFGPQEGHKKNMVSVVKKFYYELHELNEIKLFKSDGVIKSGEQRRDFIYIKDVINVILFFLENESISGVFNCGTSNANTYNSIAEILISRYNKGTIKYIDMPINLEGKYQNYTKADISKLLNVGFSKSFTDFNASINQYCEYLESK